MAKNTRKNQYNLIKKLVSCQVLIVMLGGFLVAPANATEPLKINQIHITYTDQTATISWTTNRPATGKLEYGLYSHDYHWALNTNQKTDDQAMTIFGLFPETTYFFRITATDEFSEVISFEQSFETKESSDNKAPKISNVQVAYTTGKTATIQWLTNEPATSEVEYGMTTSYGSTKTSSKKVKIHDLTITGLTDGTYYHFRVKSKDKDNNISLWYDMTFRTKLTDKIDRDDLVIYNVKPTAENNINVSETSAVISWRTNKLAEGWIRYGTSLSYGKTIATNPPRDFFQSVTLTNLAPGRTYYFQIEAKDIFSKRVKSEGHSFTTKSPAPAGGNLPGFSPQILGAGSCDVNLKTDSGYFGLYYNLVEGHPEMELYQGKDIPHYKVARENDWYNPEYFSFSRVDSKLDFGRKFFPIDEGKPGDPYHFAINWRAIINVPQDNFYSYKITSDDDSWVFIDDQLITNLNGVHPAKTEQKEIYLTAGYHKLEIYYAERSRRSSAFSFKPDARLKFHPLPEGCEVQDVLDYNQWFFVDGGQILGDYYQEPTPAPVPPVSKYVCNPDLGYTKFTALYKTADSPDIWAILETGQKHYITSPQALAQYQCSWGEIKTVSQATLDSYASARLVKTPNDPTIYYLFQRPEVQWLKINIPSPTVFISYPQNFWGNVARVAALDIQAYPDAQLIKTADSPDAYLIEGTSKRHIISEEVFNRYDYEWSEVVELNQIHLDSYENGPVLD